MASVRKLNPKDPNSPWIVEYTDASGKRRRKTPKTGLKKDADAIRKQIEREMADGVQFPASDLTVAALCDEFLKHQETRVKDGRISKGRYRLLKNNVDIHFIPSMGSIKLSDLSSSDVERCYNEMVDLGRVPHSCKDRVYNFKLLQDFAIKRGYMKATPVSQALRELRGVQKDRIRTFTQDEVAHLLRTAAQREHGRGIRMHALVNCAVNLAAFCGLRKGEVFGLQVENIDFAHRYIRVRHSVNADGELKSTKTKAGIRDVPMPSHVAALLGRWLETHYRPNSLGLFFLSQEGETARAAQVTTFTFQKWLPLLRRAGLYTADTLHFHALRHFCASWMIANGLPITEVARLLGHATFDITLQTYAHPLMDLSQQHSAMDRMTEELLSTRPLLTLARDENATFAPN